MSTFSEDSISSGPISGATLSATPTTIVPTKPIVRSPETQSDYNSGVAVRQRLIRRSATYPQPIPTLAHPTRINLRPFEYEPEGELGNWSLRQRRHFTLPIEPTPEQALVFKPRQRLPETQDEYGDLFGSLLSRQRRQGFVFGLPPAGTEYVTKLLGLAAVQPPSGQDVSKLLGLATAQPPSGEAVAKLLGLATTSPPDFIALSKLLGLVVVEPLPGCGPIPVFPTLPVGFPVKWRPTFRTTIGVSSSGREARYPSQQFAALHEIELTFEVLRDQTQNQTPYQPFVYPTGYTDYMQLCQLFLMMYGKMGLFYFDAPWDDSRTGQIIGLGDGSTTEFIAFRTFGTSTIAFAEPVGGINQIQDIQFDGVSQPTNSYSALGNIVAFNSPPPQGVTITATFTFYYLCHFVEDNQDFEEFLKDIWKVTSLKFRSVFDVFENYATTTAGASSYSAAVAAQPIPTPTGKMLYFEVKLIQVNGSTEGIFYGQAGAIQLGLGTKALPFVGGFPGQGSDGCAFAQETFLGTTFYDFGVGTNGGYGFTYTTAVGHILGICVDLETRGIYLRDVTANTNWFNSVGSTTTQLGTLNSVYSLVSGVGNIIYPAVCAQYSLDAGFTGPQEFLFNFGASPFIGTLPLSQDSTRRAVAWDSSGSCILRVGTPDIILSPDSLDALFGSNTNGVFENAIASRGYTVL